MGRRLGASLQRGAARGSAPPCAELGQEALPLLLADPRLRVRAFVSEQSCSPVARWKLRLWAATFHPHSPSQEGCTSHCALNLPARR